ncbi:hypothetical protein G5B30_08565 [Sphingobacterium sp. SGG-5]|uniref:AbiH family protein n=1 Tax=Sphingobacterium sp. SGG-5 TaxID=2710881 RepID=UPI0013EA4911|nr:AbiH family protein [Sphingobacterium sp. SGG-5]NGM61967.1 hypothetical protein [Sphingobacterium sp. SGG-5]
MNKLIIIGNGFDLAHGYPTRYSDFVLWLVKTELTNLYTDRKTNYRRENPIFNCSVNNSIYVSESLEAYLDQNIITIIERGTQEYVPQIIFGWGNDVSNTQDYSLFTVNAQTNFARKLLKSSCENWVDIENVYYKCLKEILKNSFQNEQYDCTDDILELNAQLAYLSNQLRRYLTSLEKNNLIPDFQEIFDKPIDFTNLFKPDGWEEQNFGFDTFQKTNKTYILNFNYTNSIEQYFKEKEDFVINNIHGSIIDDNNPMIFGYGDELDESFAEMEKQEIKGFLEHVKSLWYLRTRNYHDLIRFIESDYYQVQIIGHSCGRSDRTLLNMVFEHQNCNSVDIFYRVKENGLDSFNEISEEVSRQFRDKQKLRKRVLPKNKQNVIPQYIQSIEMEANIA